MENFKKIEELLKFILSSAIDYHEKKDVIEEEVHYLMRLFNVLARISLVAKKGNINLIFLSFLETNKIKFFVEYTVKSYFLDEIIINLTKEISNFTKEYS